MEKTQKLDKSQVTQETNAINNIKTDLNKDDILSYFLGTELLDSFKINSEDIGECVKVSYLFKSRNKNITSQDISNKLWYELALKDKDKDDGSLLECFKMTDDMKDSLNKFNNF